MSFYTVNSVTFSYPGKDSLFRNLSLRLEENEHIGLTGPNGCGKTTLAKLLLGILKPFCGEIYLEGKNLRNISLSLTGKKVGFVFQNPDKQLFCPTVWEQMNFSTVYGAEDCSCKAAYYLEVFGLSKYKNTSPLELSRGEKQRLALASALSRNVKFIIFDEPTTGLDILRRKQLDECLGFLREEGRGYMIISHEAEFLGKCTERLLRLRPEGVEYA